MRLNELEKRHILKKACGDVGNYSGVLESSGFYPGSLKDLRDRAERVIELVDMIELDQYRAGNNPRRNSVDD